MNDKNIYLFDTNSIYYFCKVQKNDGMNQQSFINDIKNKKYKIIEDCVLQEIFVKFRNNKRKLRMIINILNENNFYYITTNKGLIDDKLFEKLNNDYDSTIDALFDEKIDIESRLIYHIIYSVSMMFAYKLASNEGNVDPVGFNAAFANCHIIPNESQMFGFIKKRLKTAYKHDKTEQIVKDIYLKGLFDYCSKADCFMYGAKNYDPILEKITKTAEDYLNLKKTQKMFSNMHDFHIYITRFLKNENNLINDFMSAISKFFSSHGFNNEQINYLKLKYERYLTCNAKLNKNDLYDMLFLSNYSTNFLQLFNNKFNLNLGIDDIILVTFDTRLRKYISSFSSKSENFVSGYIIQRGRISTES